jgi:hypothetical protein
MSRLLLNTDKPLIILANRLGHSPMVECLPSRHKALGSILKGNKVKNTRSPKESVVAENNRHDN